LNIAFTAQQVAGDYIIYNQGAGQLTIKGSFQLNFD
jgi:hypothetical protein